MNDNDLKRVGKAEKALFDKLCKKTNADRIRAMSDEELAAWLADHPLVSEYDENNPQHKAWLDWLRQKVEESKTADDFTRAYHPLSGGPVRRTW